MPVAHLSAHLSAHPPRVQSMTSMAGYSMVAVGFKPTRAVSQFPLFPALMSAHVRLTCLHSPTLTMVEEGYSLPEGVIWWGQKANGFCERGSRGVMLVEATHPAPRVTTSLFVRTNYELMMGRFRSQRIQWYPIYSRIQLHVWLAHFPNKTFHAPESQQQLRE